MFLFCGFWNEIGVYKIQVSTVFLDEKSEVSKNMLQLFWSNIHKPNHSFNA